MTNAVLIMALIYIANIMKELKDRPVLTKTVYDMNNEEDRKEYERYEDWYYNRRKFLAK